MSDYSDFWFEACCLGSRLPQLGMRKNAQAKLASKDSIWKALNGI